MDSVGIPWNSNIPLGIQRILPELMGESKDLICDNMYKLKLDPHELPFAGFVPANPLETHTHTH